MAEITQKHAPQKALADLRDAWPYTSLSITDQLTGRFSAI